ncbi:hypothetical protein [Reyranella sp. CPCC 100927]|uniref:hypothetical protein n=1 Tax=Reyranella sp. CPCC 100927 TaxID=2599616 RepID=UPI0011B4508F|nr:hypothetical protein [Reyranella sp. CPCC 100927]TWT12833.1 hypothetical protein FQU96_11325 [Reyranella sp. CPCC 100927]
MTNLLSRRSTLHIATGAILLGAGFVRPATAETFPGTEAGARALLMQFLPNAKTDKAAVMRTLRPAAADYRAVYQDPLAGRLEQEHRKIWDAGTVLAGKPEQTELLLLVVRTDDLIDGKPALAEFPGGYRKVVGDMKRGLPIARFKFVQPGSTTGMAFDGLVHVNGRWVLIPKPWTAAAS